MAFITWFNLVLVWSKIVKIFTKKSSKWVQHNQVSWSSFPTPDYTRLGLPDRLAYWTVPDYTYLHLTVPTYTYIYLLIPSYT